MFEETRNYINTRKAFGKTLGGLQTIQHKMAEIKTSIAVCRAFIDQCIDLHERGQLDYSQASMAKYYASDLQNKVAADCLQLHGGWGYMMETPIARCYADARVQTIYVGFFLSEKLKKVHYLKINSDMSSMYFSGWQQRNYEGTYCSYHC